MNANCVLSHDDKGQMLVDVGGFFLSSLKWVVRMAPATVNFITESYLARQ